MANILVIGASRGIGREVCRAATSRGHHVRAMSRSGNQPSGAASAEPFKGDALDAGAVAAALDGIDVVVQALGVPVSLDLFTKPVTLFSEATAVLIPEMKKAGVDTLVAVTGFGAGDSNRAINPLQRIPFDLALKRAYDDKSRQEAMIEDSELDWLIVRPGVLVSAPACGRQRVLTEPDEWRNGIISRAAVAEFIVDRIDQNHYGREKPVLVSLPL
jgi:putative NADH-flavin reductase